MAHQQTHPSSPSSIQEPLELLALSGIVAPLILTNVSYRTRDALLLYNTLRLVLDIASLRRVPTGTEKTLYELVQSWGVDGKLLNDIGSVPAKLSTGSGQWGLSFHSGLTPVAAVVSSRSQLEDATELVLRLGALLGPANIVFSALGVTASLWRAKRHEEYPWSEITLDIDQMNGPDAKTMESLKRARELAGDRVGQEPMPSTNQMFAALAIKTRLLCVVLLCAVPVAHFDASGHAARAVAVLASPSFTDDLQVSGLVLRVLYSLGLDGELATKLVALTGHADGSGGKTFQRRFIDLHEEIKRRLVRHTGDGDADRAVADMQRYINQTGRGRERERRKERGGREADDTLNTAPEEVFASKQTLARTQLGILVEALKDLVEAAAAIARRKPPKKQLPTTPTHREAVKAQKEARRGRIQAQDRWFGAVHDLFDSGPFADAVAALPSVSRSAALAGAGLRRVLAEGRHHLPEGDAPSSATGKR